MMNLVNVFPNCQVVIDGKQHELYHYGILVLQIDRDRVVFNNNSRYSLTTSRYVKKYLESLELWDDQVARDHKAIKRIK